MEKFKGFFKGIAVLLAKFYNSLPSKVKIGLMVATSFVISGWLNLFVRDLTDYNAGQVNEYVKTMIDAFIPLLTIVINLVQQWGVDAGTKELAANGDKTTIKKLETAVAEKKDLIASGK